MTNRIEVISQTITLFKKMDTLTHNESKMLNIILDI